MPNATTLSESALPLLRSILLVRSAFRLSEIMIDGRVSAQVVAGAVLFKGNAGRRDLWYSAPMTGWP
jgi:hypothetical protein